MIKASVTIMTAKIDLSSCFLISKDKEHNVHSHYGPGDISAVQKMTGC